jgi:hypothetical protein
MTGCAQNKVCDPAIARRRTSAGGFGVITIASAVAVALHPFDQDDKSDDDDDQDTSLQRSTTHQTEAKYTVRADATERYDVTGPLSGVHEEHGAEVKDVGGEQDRLVIHGALDRFVCVDHDLRTVETLVETLLGDLVEICKPRWRDVLDRFSDDALRLFE